MQPRPFAFVLKRHLKLYVNIIWCKYLLCMWNGCNIPVTHTQRKWKGSLTPKLVNLSLLTLLESEHRREILSEGKLKPNHTSPQNYSPLKFGRTLVVPLARCKWSSLVLQIQLTFICLRQACPVLVLSAASSRPDLITPGAQRKSVSHHSCNHASLKQMCALITVCL